MARAMGDLLTFVINGVEVASLRDSELREGTTGVFVTGDINEAMIYRFTVEAPALRIGIE
jgi:hypothetical protein